MFFKNDIEQTIENNDKKLTDLETQHELLEQEIQKLYQELKLTPEQINTFISNPDNFTENDWKELQDQKQKLDAKLQLDIENIRNPLKTKKTYANRRVESNWLFVR